MSISLLPSTRHYDARQSVLRELSVSLGRTIGGIGQDLRGPQGVFARAERLLEKLVQFGGYDLARKWHQRIGAIAEGRTPPPNVPATWNLAQEADMQEDVAELAYLQERTPKNLARLIACKEKSQRFEDASLMTLYRERDAAKIL